MYVAWLIQTIVIWFVLLLSKTLVEHVIRDDYLNPEIKKQIDKFNDKLDKCLDDTKFPLEDSPRSVDLDYDDDNHNHGVITNHGITPSDDMYGDMIIDNWPEADDEEAIDKYLTCEIIMDVGSGNERKGRVTKRSRVHDEEPIGVAHNNPLFDTREYDVEFIDGSIEKYAANIITENMFAKVDDKGREHLIMKEIVDHKKYHTAIPISEGKLRSYNGNESPKVTTRGWKLLFEWRDGQTSWIDLKDLK